MIDRIPLPTCVCLGLLLGLTGCDARIEHFEPNELFALTVGRTRAVDGEKAATDAAQVVEQLFGTPNQPMWPDGLSGDPERGPLVDSENLMRAAGPISSDRDGTNFGLYRKHCVTCHGVAGSGSGPAALLQNPYPRNVRHGVFKWKSTERNAKPTRDDLFGLLRRGVPGTAMPSFTLLPEQDLEALVDYVIYLSVRGEVERRLIAAAVDELGYDESRPREPELKLDDLTRDDLLPHDDASPVPTEAVEMVREIVAAVSEKWAAAEDRVVEVPLPEPLGGDELAESIERGEALFHGQIANCVGCHGPSGNGQAVTVDYDDWSKEYSTRLGITPEDRDAMRPFRQAGALPPRRTEPRKLTDGVFRGGADPETLYRRISQGIAGTPMPALEISEAASGIGLRPEQAWDLVRYVRWLGGEPTGDEPDVTLGPPSMSDGQVSEDNEPES